MSILKRGIVATFALCSLIANASNGANTDNEKVKSLKHAFVTSQLKAGFNRQEITDFLAKAHYNQKIITAITTPWEAKPWYLYQKIFLTDKRLTNGIAFWKTYHNAITKAAQQFDVDPEIIVSIIGIETFYGNYMGNYPAIDALYTLGFYYPPRAKFFSKELANLQTLIKEEHLELSTLNGSYAGAIGYGQFIPSSYRHYAVDFDNDGKRDLIGSPIDAIGSVANYFHKHHWRKGKPVALPLANQHLPSNLSLWNGKKFHNKVADILSSKVTLAKNINIDNQQPATIIKLEQANQNDYWLGLHNFYVITRYNGSPLYAMAVYQFSQQLKAAYAKK